MKIIYHYVYKITNNKPRDERKYYIGVRSATCIPEKDIKYWSSSKYLKAEINKVGVENFSKEILSVWECRELANIEEIRLHRKLNVGVNKQYYNKAAATRDGFFVFDQVTVIDVRNNKVKTIPKDEFNNSNFYKGVTKGQITVLDTRDGCIKNVSKEDYKISDYYKNQNSKRYNIFNKLGQLMFECFGNFKQICQENNLPENALRRSSRENKKVYQNAKASQITKLKKDGLYDFEGWYAIRLD